MKFYFSLYIFLSLLIAEARAQILRVDKSHLNSDSAGYFTATLNLNFSLDSRSVAPSEQLVFTRLTSRADLLYVAENTAYIFVGSIDYFKSGNTQPFSTGYGHVRVNFFRKKVVSLEMYAQMQYDEVRRMRLRSLVGTGARVTAMDKPNVDIHIGSGIMYEIERWRAVEGDPTSEFQKNIPKASSYVGIEFILSNNSHLTLWGLHQVGVDGEDDLFRTRYAGEATLNFYITKRLTWTNRFSYFYDAQPVIPINQAYFQLTNGLQIKF
jgi:Protein of unknown function, DUF481